MKTKTLMQMLDWPLVWRWAANRLSLRPHEMVDEELCPPCAARLRRTRYKHKGVLGFARTTICVKCGLSSTYWERWPKCEPNTRTARVRKKKIALSTFHPVGW